MFRRACASDPLFTFPYQQNPCFPRVVSFVRQRGSRTLRRSAPCIVQDLRQHDGGVLVAIGLRQHGAPCLKVVAPQLRLRHDDLAGVQNSRSSLMAARPDAQA